MQTSKILHQLLKKSSPNLHSKRISALLEVVSSLFNHGKLSLFCNGLSELDC